MLEVTASSDVREGGAPAPWRITRRSALTLRRIEERGLGRLETGRRKLTDDRSLVLERELASRHFALLPAWIGGGIKFIKLRGEYRSGQAAG